ncbi:MAG: alpha/beta hydrolase, partial [Clostridia bacterium]|nr:alpha/beta hydrolase [Clostridia bacterium]
SLEGSRGHALRMMMVFLPEALFPTDRNAAKLCKKLSGPDSNVIADNAELFRHWKLLLKNFNNMSISKHDTRKQFSIADYKGIRDETLLIIGKYDKFAYYPESLKILGDLGMNYEIIEDAGHVANHEFPGLINQKIIEFLTR